MLTCKLLFPTSKVIDVVSPELAQQS